jgi:hypothetical protein
LKPAALCRRLRLLVKPMLRRIGLQRALRSLACCWAFRLQLLKPAAG